MSGNDTRVMVIGLDGATFDLIRPWAAAGKLPVFQRLLAEGASGNLESTVPPVTSPAWPTFMTGKNPGRHGVFDYIRPRHGHFDLVNATSIDSAVLWEILSAHGKRVGVMNVPVTYPPRPVNGFLITGLLSPSGAEITYPPGFLKPYEARLGPYRVVPHVQYKPGNEDEFIADLNDLVERRARYALTLMEEEPWDFLMVHFLATDIIQHALWKHMDSSHPQHDPALATRYGDAILRLYQKIDHVLGEIMARLDNHTILMVMSDHGFGPLHWVVNLNNLFMQAGLLRLKRNPWTRLRAVLFYHGLTPARVYQWLSRLGLQNLTWRVSKQVRNRIVSQFLSFSDVDWEHTLAYSIGHVGQIYINVDGQSGTGAVHPQEYAAVRERIIAVLHGLRHPDTGQPLVERIIPREEVCSGPHCDEGPDLHVVMDGYRCISFPLFATDERVITRQIRGDSGCHRSHGVFIAWGPFIARGRTVSGARIVDLAPTILHIMGLPVPDDMDGRVLEDIYVPEFREAHPVRYDSRAGQEMKEQAALSAEETAELEDRLRGLGYLG